MQEKVMTGFLSEHELARLTPSELVDRRMPIPTQIVFSDEYFPGPQTEQQRAVEAHLNAMADELGGKRGLDRRRFFGGNNARLYDIDVKKAERALGNDQFAALQRDYDAGGGGRATCGTAM
jgi:hypothetical protein